MKTNVEQKMSVVVSNLIPRHEKCPIEVIVIKNKNKNVFLQFMCITFFQTVN